MISEYSIQFWVMAGTLLTAVATLGLVVGAFMAWYKAKGTLEQMQEDANRTEKRFQAEIQARAEHLRSDKVQEAVYEFVSLHQEILHANSAEEHVLTPLVDRLRMAQTRLEMTMGLQSHQSQLTYFTMTIKHFGQIEFDNRDNVGIASMEAFLAHRRSVSFLYDVMTSLHKGESDVEEVLLEIGRYTAQLIDTYPKIFDESLVKELMRRDDLLNL
ncbi:hypothetical protein [Glutamicibacter sp. MCAF14]|uniref:hypothetical protein n=1 Tax=Glutamicibacter sp. MCAF14 TaxID=3233043 RepID=UPI003F90C586